METKAPILKQVVVFLVITTVITTGIYVWMFTSSRVIGAMHGCFMYAPGVSAIITSLLFRDKLQNYGWRLGKARFLGYSFILPILISLLAYGLAWTTGLADVYGDGVRNYRWARMLGFDLPVPLVVGLLSKMTLAFVLTFVFVLGEEIGWTGFLTPKLSRISSVGVTSLIVGGFWAVWHWPALIAGEYGYGTPLWVALPGFTLVMISASFLRTVLRLKSGSLWVGVVLHTSHNVYLMGIFHDLTAQQGYADYLVSETGVLTGVVYLIVALIFWKLQMKEVETAGEL
ncbi:MAG: CPBP family intramembrane metalloprotease [Candidatus Marinimicrobia bacterium]|nr:CPBP family intramembrane metalloprotease [Candidatus Neomarinimicrobiota bacterium]